MQHIKSSVVLFEYKFVTEFFFDRGRYTIFFKDQMGCLKNEFPNSKERLIKVSQIWKDLSNKDKESYREKENEKIMKYMVELQRWFQVYRIISY